MQMPRSIQEILDRAEDLARDSEDYEPGSGDERSVEEYMLRRGRLGPGTLGAAGRRRDRGGTGFGWSWARAGKVLGTSAQAAPQRYGELVERV